MLFFREEKIETDAGRNGLYWLSLTCQITTLDILPFDEQDSQKLI